MKRAALIFLFINSALLVSLFVMAWLRREAHYDMMRESLIPICFPIGPSLFGVPRSPTNTTRRSRALHSARAMVL